MKRVLLATAVLLFGLSTAGNMTAQSGRLRAGAAKLDITLKQSDLLTPTDIIRDHLFARAIVVDDGHTCAVLIGFDLSKVDENAVTKRCLPGLRRPPDARPRTSSSRRPTRTVPAPREWKWVRPLPKEQEDYIVAVANAAKAKLAPARVGYATAKVDLNVNREHFDLNEQKWLQEPNPDGPSDKTLAVVEFMGADNVPIGVYMNYGMHADQLLPDRCAQRRFSGRGFERYIEKLFDDRTVAIYSQAPEGDQNPMFGEFAASARGERPGFDGEVRS